MDVLRGSPWSLVMADFSEDQLFGVKLVNGQVLFVDGVASKVLHPTHSEPTEPWMLVGVCFNVVAAELVERIEHVDESQELATIPFDQVREIVPLAYDLGNNHTVTVINPNNYSIMISVMQKRLRVNKTA